jgi:hypothetical protein
MNDAIARTLARCRTIHPGEEQPFRLESRLASPATADDIRRAWGRAALPPSVVELWLTAGGAELFVDVTYGQWGLRLFSPAVSADRSRHEFLERPSDVRPDDVVLAEFLGDQDLLLVDAGGQPLIALPLDVRADWYRPAGSLGAFLDRYVTSDGRKFWSEHA